MIDFKALREEYIKTLLTELYKAPAPGPLSKYDNCYNLFKDKQIATLPFHHKAFEGYVVLSRIPSRKVSNTNYKYKRLDIDISTNEVFPENIKRQQDNIDRIGSTSYYSGKFIPATSLEPSFTTSIYLDLETSCDYLDQDPHDPENRNVQHFSYISLVLQATKESEDNLRLLTNQVAGTDARDPSLIGKILELITCKDINIQKILDRGNQAELNELIDHLKYIQTHIK